MHNVIFDDRDITVSGLCLDHITSEFPVYSLRDAERDITSNYQSTGGTNTLPNLPSKIGVEIHLMIGVKYLRYHPKLIHQLPSELSIFQSAFKSPNGGEGVVGGPHKSFTYVHKNFYKSTFLVDRPSIPEEHDVSFIGYTEDKTTELIDDPKHHLSRMQRVFEEVESTGTEMSYRCPTC